MIDADLPHSHPVLSLLLADPLLILHEVFRYVYERFVKYEQDLLHQGILQQRLHMIQAVLQHLLERFLLVLSQQFLSHGPGKVSFMDK